MRGETRVVTGVEKETGGERKGTIGGRIKIKTPKKNKKEHTLELGLGEGK